MTLYVSDLDGTLIDSRLTIPPESAASINAAIRRGDAFAVATARTPATVGEILAPISGALPAVVMNGAGIYDFERREFVRLFPLKRSAAEAAREALKALSMSGFWYTVQGEKLFVYYDQLENLSQQMFFDLRKKKPMKVFVQGSCPEGVDPVFCCVIDSEERTARLAETLSPIPGMVFHRYRDSYDPDSWYVEIYDQAASKAAGIRWLKENYGGSRVVCFGDNRNDLQMFAEADECYAVANAVPELKAAATGILTDPDLAAVGRFIEKDSSQQKGE